MRRESGRGEREGEHRVQEEGQCEGESASSIKSLLLLWSRPRRRVSLAPGDKGSARKKSTLSLWLGLSIVSFSVCCSGYGEHRCGVHLPLLGR